MKANNGLIHEELGLLDAYAGQALQGMLADSANLDSMLPEELAHDAFLFAKSMLRERRSVLNEIRREGL